MNLSVIIPTCHRNALLAKCLDCLKPGVQTLTPDQYEVIVSDDGSQSTAEQMVREQYPWVRWTEGPRRGPAANRNHGARQARGRWLAFTDDDCLPTAGWLGAFAQASKERGTRIFEGKTTCEAGISSPLYEAPVNLEGGQLWSCNFLIHADLFIEMGGFDEDYIFYMEDVDLGERLRMRNEITYFVGEAIVDHPPRRRPSGYKKGQTFEVRVQHWYKTSQKRPLFVPFLQHVKHRIYEISKFKPSRDAALALASLAFETGYVATHLTAWRKKYRGSLRR